MTGGLLAMLAANAACVLGAWKLAIVTGSSGPADRFLRFMLFRLLFITFAVLVAGLLGALSPGPLGIGGVVALGALVLARAHRSLTQLPAINTQRWILVLGTLLLVRVLAQVWFFAPHLEDSTNWYLPKIAEWIRCGAFTREMGTHDFVTYPAGFELIQTWWVVFIRHDVLIEMAGVEFLFLGFAAVWTMAEQIGSSGRGALLASFLYILAPGVHLGATACLNDQPIAALVIATAALLLSRAHPGIVLATGGIGLGIKPTYGYAVPGILMLAWFLRRERIAKPPVTRATWAVGAAGLAAGAFWYVRNFVWFGNPFHPLGTSEVALSYAPQFGPRFSSLWSNFNDLIDFRIYDKHGPAALVDQSAGWGATVFGCGIVALFVALRNEKRFRAPVIAFGISLLSVCLLSIHDPWAMKYVLFFPSIICIAVGWLVVRVREMVPLVAIGVIVQIAGTNLSYDLTVSDFRVLVAQPWQERSASQLYRGLPSADAVGFFGRKRGQPYLLYRPDYSCRVVYLRAASADELLLSMRRNGLKTLFCEPSGKEREILLEAIRRGSLVSSGDAWYELRGSQGD